MKVHVVFNPDNDVIGVVEATDDASFYMWLHVAHVDIKLSPAMQVETTWEFMEQISD